MTSFFIYVGIFLFLLILGVVFGSMAERRHYADLMRREAALVDVIQTNSPTFLEPITAEQPPMLVCAETVIATDYLKRFLASIRNFFGGEVRAFHSLMDRARRESVVKILEQAKAQGYNAICNLRLEPADVGGNVQPQGTAMVCIVGSATAYRSGTTVHVAPAKPLQY